MSGRDKRQRERVVSRAQDTDLFCQPCPASRGWSNRSPANGRGRDPGVLGRPAPPLSPPAPPPGSRAPRREPGRGRRQGREERGRRGRREQGWEGGGGVGREKKKENIFRVPACRVSVRFGRKCVGYFGAVTWAGGLREAPRRSQPRARAPPQAPHYREPLTLRRSIPATARSRDLGARRPPFPLLPPPPGESGGEAGSAASGRLGPRVRWAGGGGSGERRRFGASQGWSGCPQGLRGASCPDLGVSPDVEREWGRF